MADEVQLLQYPMKYVCDDMDGRCHELESRDMDARFSVGIAGR